MAQQPLTIGLGDGRAVDAVLHAPAAAAAAPWVVVYAPGAGSNLNDGFGVAFCEQAATAGMAAVRFQFAYQQARSRRPDPPALLQATWRAAIEAARPLGARLAVGGAPRVGASPRWWRRPARRWMR